MNEYTHVYRPEAGVAYGVVLNIPDQSRVPTMERKISGVFPFTVVTILADNGNADMKPGDTSQHHPPYILPRSATTDG